MKSFLAFFRKTAFAGSNRHFPSSARCFSATMTVRQAINGAIDEEMARDESVFVIGEEVAQYNGAYKITEGLLKKYGEKRVVDTPITEMGFTGISVGAALNGLRPICEFMSMSFSLQSIDHIINSAAKLCYMTGGRQKVPVVFRGINGAAIGVAAQHTQDLTPWYASVPGLKVFAPYDAEDARGMLKSAVRDDNPVVLLENELLYGRAFAVSAEALGKDFATPFGQARVMREGGDVTIVAHSRMVGEALAAAEALAEEGVAAEVINLRCLRPLDVGSVFRSVRKTNRLVTVEEGWPQSGIGAEICGAFNDCKSFYDLDAPIERVTGADIPTPYAASLEIHCTPTAKEIVKACKRALNKK